MSSTLETLGLSFGDAWASDRLTKDLFHNDSVFSGLEPPLLEINSLTVVPAEIKTLKIPQSSTIKTANTNQAPLDRGTTRAGKMSSAKPF